MASEDLSLLVRQRGLTMTGAAGVYLNSDERMRVSGPTDREATHPIVGNTVTANAVDDIHLFQSHANTIRRERLIALGAGFRPPFQLQFDPSSKVRL
jgi:hypothetical protein